MEWVFIEPSVITELNTGLSIRLIAGSWTEPIEIRPDKTTVSVYDQARLLRLGLAIKTGANQAIYII